MQTIMNYESGDKTVVIAEAGSACRAWTMRHDHGNLLVVAQLPEELPTAFANRAVKRIRRLTGTAWHPRVAIVALNSDCGGSALSSRIAVLRALVTTLATTSAEFVLSLDARFPHACRHEMCALVQVLVESAPDLDIHVELVSESDSRNGPSASVTRRDVLNEPQLAVAAV
jgi:hypothetical protein